jgi:signal transduction histidine kinase
MHSIGTRFSLAVGGLAIVFSGVILYRSWSRTKAHVDELTSRQAELALEFDLAIRQYAGEAIRPAMEKRVGKDEFVIEAMSTSYIARSVFDKVHEKFPDYVIKFSSDNPRNPVNLAGPEERELLQYFRDNPQETRWVGKLAMNGNEYLTHSSAMRTERSCLRCHGRPEDSPKSLLARFGATGGFDRKVGDVAGVDMIAIPMDRVNAALRASATNAGIVTAVYLLLLLAAILIAFRYMVARRLAAITSHFQTAATQTGDGVVATVAVQGNDEISILARSFNTLAARLQNLYASLEVRVQQRTAEVRREQETLRHLLRSSDHERRLIAYEIHDGLAQQLAGAIMHFECHDRLRGQNPGEAAKAFTTGLMLLRQSHAEARRLISGVRPPILDEAGVVAAIEHIVNDGRGAAAGVNIEFHQKVDFGRLDPVLENAIYRIVQEGLTNALKYSQSKNVRIELVQAGEELHVAIQDWGVGFGSDKERDECFGLKGIRERARLLGGTATIETAPGSGTRITVTLPVVLRTSNGHEGSDSGMG